MQANAQYNILNTSSLKESLLPTPGGKQRLIRLAERSLATAVAAQNRGSTVKIHRALAELLANEDAVAGNGAPACAELPGSGRDDPRAPRRSGLLMDQGVAPSSRAIPRSLGGGAPGARGDRHARTAREPRPIAQAGACGSAGRRTRDRRPSAIRSRPLMRSRVLRSLQDDAGSSAELFSTWTSDYYWLCGPSPREPSRGRPRACVLDHRAHAGAGAARHAGTVADRRGARTSRRREQAHAPGGHCRGAAQAHGSNDRQRREADEPREAGRAGAAKSGRRNARSPCASLTATARAPRSPVSAPFSRRSPTTKPCCRFTSGCGKRSRESSAAARGSWC